MKMREVAELDFGLLGFVTDRETGWRRPLWVLLVRMDHDSRRCFLWHTRTQKLDDVVAGLEAAWEFFGDVPRHLAVNSFPIAVAGPDRRRPRLTPGFLEYARYRGFTVGSIEAVYPRYNSGLPTAMAEARNLRRPPSGMCFPYFRLHQGEFKNRSHKRFNVE